MRKGGKRQVITWPVVGKVRDQRKKGGSQELDTILIGGWWREKKGGVKEHREMESGKSRTSREVAVGRGQQTQGDE